MSFFLLNPNTTIFFLSLSTFFLSFRIFFLSNFFIFLFWVLFHGLDGLGVGLGDLGVVAMVARGL